MVLVATVTTTICFLLYNNFAVKQYKNVARSTAKLVASSIDADMVDEYLKYGDGKRLSEKWILQEVQLSCR